MAEDKELSLHDQIAAAYDSVEVDPQETAGRGTDAVAPEPAGVERARDESGRFAPKDNSVQRETLTLKDGAAQQQASQQAIDPTQQATAKPQQPIDAAKERIAPPTSWLGAAKTKWDRLPPEVQKEISERWAKFDGDSAEVGQFKDLVDVNREWIVNAAGSMNAGMAELMQFGRMATSGSLDEVGRLIDTIAARRGIDLRARYGGQQGAQPAPASAQPDLSHIDRLVEQKLQPLQALFQQQEQQQTEATTAQVRTFIADPAHPYFNDVAPTIERLLKSGEIPPGDPMTRLKAAYDQATWMNPAIRSQLMAAQTEEAEKRRAADAEKARLASRASLRGSPLPNGSAAGGGKGQSVHDAVRQAYDEAAGA